MKKKKRNAGNNKYFINSHEGEEKVLWSYVISLLTTAKLYTKRG
jgi:hypothetical protein